MFAEEARMRPTKFLSDHNRSYSGYVKTEKEGDKKKEKGCGQRIKWDTEGMVVKKQGKGTGQ